MGIMTVALRAIERRETAKFFLPRRFLRIYPAFWFSIIVVVLVPYALAGLSMLKDGAFAVPSQP